MNFLKKWIWGEEGDAEEQQPQDKKPTHTSSHRRQGNDVPRIDPLLRDVPPGGSGGIQGLDWYQKSLLEDADGDCATDFLEESQGLAAKKNLALQSQKGKVSPAKVSGLALERGNITSSVYISSKKSNKRSR